MGLIGSAIGVAGGIAGGILSNKALRRAYRQVMDNINERKKENRDWYDRRYNEDATQRADAQAILTATEESIKRRNRQAAGVQAVMGGTSESLAAEREANAQSLADATTNIAVNAERRKDAIEQQYLQTNSQLDDQMNNMILSKAQGKAAAIQGATSALASAAGSMPF